MECYKVSQESVQLEELNCGDNKAGADFGSKWTWFEFEIYPLKLTSKQDLTPHARSDILPSSADPHQVPPMPVFLSAPGRNSFLNSPNNLCVRVIIDAHFCLPHATFPWKHASSLLHQI